jgi:TonB family protein
MHILLLSIAMASLAFASAPTAPRELGPRRAMAERPLNQLFSSADYPLRARRHRLEGTVQFRLEIDSEGNIASCDIVGSSGSPALDAATCRVVRERARFSPAVDSRGQPLPDTVNATVHWRMTDIEPPMRFARERAVTTISWSEPDPICTEVYNGEPMGRLSASECMSDYYSLATAVRDTRGGLEFAVLTEIIPDGDSASGTGLQDHGERVWFEEVELTVAPDGRISDCRSIRSETSPAFPHEAGQDYCQMYVRADTRFEPVDPRHGARRARASSALYMREDGGN